MTVKCDIHIHKLHVNGFSVVYCALCRRMRHIGEGWQTLTVHSPEKYQEQALAYLATAGEIPTCMVNQFCHCTCACLRDQCSLLGTTPSHASGFSSDLWIM